MCKGEAFPNDGYPLTPLGCRRRGDKRPIMRECFAPTSKSLEKPQCPLVTIAFQLLPVTRSFFICEEDLWRVSASGGIARRLTPNRGEATRPMLSPDGTQLAFVGFDEGDPEIYWMPALGGPAKRLTFMGGLSCQTVGWRADATRNQSARWWKSENSSPRMPREFRRSMPSRVARCKLSK